ncbi:hypothetical protein ERO13_A03G051350v2 [Gossypium hirsutum]|nr:hypothetical protein ERO13_A03G051350v2 [Gossypium hirsutum]KAG4207189.1 hypothetical protein ERO13_A03G051350v2 [Gossypium hirsutum]
MVVQRNNKLLCFTNLHLYKAYMAIIPGCWNLTEMSETCIATRKHHINKITVNLTDYIHLKQPQSSLK